MTFIKYLLKLPLLTQTLFVSIIIHCLAIYLMPRFVVGHPAEFTSRDIQFYMANILSNENVLLSKPPSPNKTVSSVTLPDDRVSPPKSELSKNEPLNLTAYGLGIRILPVPPETNSALPRKQKIPSDKTNKKSLSETEAQRILKQLENEIHMREISSQNDNQRNNSFKYLDIVREQIKAHYFIPPEAKWQKMKGLVLLQVTVATHGEINNIIFVSHSDFPLLDIAARVAIERAAPFPNVEKMLDLKEIKFIVPMRY